MARQLPVLILSLALVIPSTASAVTIVTYSGTVYEKYLSPGPAPNSHVIAGTFSPSYDWINFKCDYGVDEACNMADNGFERAVSDGNLFPIGSGTLTNANGQFTGSGITSAAPGTPIFLFAFGGPNSAGSIQSVAFSSSSDASFLVPASGNVNLNSSLVDIHILSGAYSMNGLVLSGALPVPEASTIASGLIFAMLIPGSRPRRPMKV